MDRRSSEALTRFGFAVDTAKRRFGFEHARRYIELAVERKRFLETGQCGIELAQFEKDVAHVPDAVA